MDAEFAAWFRSVLPSVAARLPDPPERDTRGRPPRVLPGGANLEPEIGRLAGHLERLVRPKRTRGIVRDWASGKSRPSARFRAELRPLLTERQKRELDVFVRKWEERQPRA